MIPVEVYLLNGHARSANVNRIVVHYLESCPGVRLKKVTVKSAGEIVDALKKHGLRDLPAMVTTEGVWYDEHEIEEWCKELVRQMNPGLHGMPR